MLSKSIPTKFQQGDVERLAQLSKLYDRPISYLIREATRMYLDDHAKRLAFLEEARLAEAHYRSTGLHCTQKDMENWLDDLASGKRTSKPQCQQ